MDTVIKVVGFCHVKDGKKYPASMTMSLLQMKEYIWVEHLGIVSTVSLRVGYLWR